MFTGWRDWKRLRSHLSGGMLGSTRKELRKFLESAAPLCRGMTVHRVARLETPSTSCFGWDTEFYT